MKNETKKEMLKEQVSMAKLFKAFEKDGEAGVLEQLKEIKKGATDGRTS